MEQLRSAESRELAILWVDHWLTKYNDESYADELIEQNILPVLLEMIAQTEGEARQNSLKALRQLLNFKAAGEQLASLPSILQAIVALSLGADVALCETALELLIFLLKMHELPYALFDQALRADAMQHNRSPYEGVVGLIDSTESALKQLALLFLKALIDSARREEGLEGKELVQRLIRDLRLLDIDGVLQRQDTVEDEGLSRAVEQFESASDSIIPGSRLHIKRLQKSLLQVYVRVSTSVRV
jgi:hypothetical protein